MIGNANDDDGLTPILTPDDARNRILVALARHIEDDEKREKFVRTRIEKLLSNQGGLSDPRFLSSNNEELNLLEEMISRGLFPSFSFPLDVANFEALGTKKRMGSPQVEKYVYASTSQDLKVALSEFSPGRRLTINKQTFLVNGIGLRFPSDPINQIATERLDEIHYEVEDDGTKIVREEASEWKFFHRCTGKDCGVIFKSTSPKYNLNGEAQCDICACMDDDGDGDSDPGDVKSTRMITPEVFRPLIVPYWNGRHYPRTLEGINKSFQEMRAPEDAEELAARSKVGRASLPTPLTDFNMESEGFVEKWSGKDGEWEGLKVWHLKDKDELGEGTRLLVVNEGPDGHGFRICPSCGNVKLNPNQADGQHHRPYAIPKLSIHSYVSNELGQEGDEADATYAQLNTQSESACNGTHSDPVCLGFSFRTDIIVFRFPIREPMTTELNTPSFEAAVRAIKEALITVATEQLGLINREIGGNFRKIAIPRDDGQTFDQYIDIFLYDQVSGGAGLVTRIGDENESEVTVEGILNGTYDDDGKQIQIGVLDILGGEQCVDNQPCGRVCTGCLLDFRNQQEADRMSRPLGLQMLEYIRTGAAPDHELFSTTEGESSSFERTQELVDILKDVYDNSGITLSDPDSDNDGIITIERNGETRRMKVHSILRGYSAEEGSLLLWDATRSQRNRLDEEVVQGPPYEVLRDAPHTLMAVFFPANEDTGGEEVGDNIPFFGM